VNVPVWVWLVTVGAATAFLLVDVFVIGRRPHEPTMKESARHLAFFVAAAVAFGLGVWAFAGGRFAAEYFAGWLTEYSLSVDNLFIFLIIMSKFAVPRHLQQSALLVGIILALVFRGIFIGVGAAAINNFSWIFYLFGAFLIWTAVKLAREGQSEDEEFEENALIRWTRNNLPATDQYHGTHLTVRQDGRRLMTPMLVVLISLGTTDLLFALDSIPAIYGLTKEPYLVLMANIFALMGLRQLYFLIGGLLQRLVYLSIGLSFLLFFIGVKLVLHALHENELPFINGGEHVGWAPDVPIWVSLGVIIGTLVITTVASLMKTGLSGRKPADQV
jgi:tellurite resistance protein TerC